MKNLLNKLFGRAAPSSDPATQIRSIVASAELMRQSILESASPEQRARRELELGKLLGSSGLDPSPDDSSEVWVAAVCHAAEKSQALGWLSSIEGDDRLELIAAAAHSAETRLAAAMRIADLARIEKLANLMRDKDKGVYRHCQTFLKIHAEQARRAERIDALVRYLRQTLGERPIPEGRLYELRREFAQLGDGDDLAQCRELLDQAGRREHEEAGKLREIKNGHKQAMAVLKDLADAPWPVGDRLDPWKNASTALAASLSSLPDWLARHPTTLDLSTSLKSIDARLAAIDEDLRRAETCRRFLAETESAEITPELTDAWARLPMPDANAARSELTALWESRLAKTPARPVKPAPEPARTSHDFSRFRQALEELDRALESGETQAAFALDRELDQISADTPPPRSLAERYRTARGKLSRLRDWARWSGERVREELIEKAEALLTDEVDVSRLAEEVPKLRADWRRLDGHSPPTPTQRKRFDSMLDQAFQPVLTHRAEQSARRKEALEARIAFIEEAEAWMQGLDWEQANIQEIQRHLTSLRNRWRALAHAGAREERQLNKRCDAFLAEMNAKLEPFIIQETERRERMVAAAERLQSLTDINEAVSQARLLQQRWRDEAAGAQLPRAQSERQWQQFRGAIDDVFARRNAERAERTAKLQEQIDARRALLDEFEQFLNGEPGLPQLEHELAVLRERWSQAEEPKPARQRDNPGQRASALFRRAGAAIKELRAAKQRELLETIIRKAALAEELETAGLDGQSTDELVARIQNEWAQLPHLPSDIERKLHERLKAAPGIASDQLEEGQRRRNQQLIDLEIFLDLPTPSRFAQDRQNRQLELLQGEFRDRKTSAELLDRLVACCATAAPPDRSRTERIDKVCGKLAEILAKESAS